MKTDYAKVYSEILELTTLNQFNSILDLKYVTRGVLLPNASMGKAVPSGSIIITDDGAHIEWLSNSYGTLVIQTGFQAKDIKKNAEFILNSLTGLLTTGFIEILCGVDKSVWILIRSKGNKSSRMKLWGSVSKILQVYSWWGYIVQQIFDQQDESIEEKGGLFIHRIGTTKANKGKVGVTLGNIRDGSFITVGKGCKNSISSTACFSGKILSTTKSTVLTDDQVVSNCLKGVINNLDEVLLDKLPYVYKNPFHVMGQQKNFVDIIYHLKPLIHIRW